ncbi:MAG: pantoate--beta-alanine ligase [Gaiellaceae bacterium]|nr:pantoate--beta-alanine ligase [Gaiellaceae bacterium]
MKIARTIDELRTLMEPMTVGFTTGLVPTMGAFHEGHLSLFRAARKENDTVVASLFVNPTQFGPAEDLTRYPRDEARDAALAAAEGVDYLFVPPQEELYPPGYQTWVDVTELGAILEGAARPGHFRGVATVCLKLFNIVRPQAVYFGQKDAQQVAVLRQMLRDLNMERDLDLCVLPTVRDADGLALSSRNAYLSATEREQALALPRALATGSVGEARTRLASAPGITVDYVDTLEDGRVLAAAIRVGSTRLIDNIIVEGATP